MLTLGNVRNLMDAVHQLKRFKPDHPVYVFNVDTGEVWEIEGADIDVVTGLVFKVRNKRLERPED